MAELPEHPDACAPRPSATFHPRRWGRRRSSSRSGFSVGLNTFLPGQAHALHATKASTRSITSSKAAAAFLLVDREIPMQPARCWSALGRAPRHPQRRDANLLVLAILAPGPGKKS